MSDFTMPALGADMEVGTLVEWLKQPGDVLHRGDIIAVVDTEKGAIEIEVFEDGVLEALVVPAGARVPVGTVLARIATTGGMPGTTPPPSSPPRAPVPASPTTPDAASLAPGAPRRRASPAARRRAEVLGLSLEDVTSAGGGPITLADVERAAARRGAATSPDGAPSRLAGMRRAIAAAMSRAKREIPHAYVSTSIDMGRALAWLQAQNAQRPLADRLLPVALLVKAVSGALGEVPALNGHWHDGQHRPVSAHHIALAVFVRGGGLVAPAIHDVSTRDLTNLMHALSDVVARARIGTLRGSELTDATITVTNLGERGVESTFGIIYPPQVALVGFGRVVERPWAVDGRVEVRPVLTATLSFDHRAVDGHLAGRFLDAVDRRLQHPEAL